MSKNRQKRTTQSSKSTGGEFKIELMNSAQKLALAAYQKHDVLFLIGPAGTGKAQPIDSIVFTPSGAKTMGEIKVGDQVLTPYGKATVESEHPQGKVEIYRVNFVDGDSTECCKNHLWKIHNPNNGWEKPKIVDTNWIMENCCNSNRRNLEVELPTEVNFEPLDVIIDPYLLGLLIGDGSFRGSAPKISTVDNEILESVRSLIEESYKLNKVGECDYSISCEKTEDSENHYTMVLKSLGLWGKKSEHKFLPTDFLVNSKDVRISVLQGLMDTYGSVDNRGYVKFSTSSFRLAQDVKFLVQSLGGLCKIVERKTKCLPSYRCHIKYKNPSELFRIKHKKQRCIVKEKLVRRIKSVDYVGVKEAKCIKLNNEEGLYLTNDFIVTHNTFLATAFAIKSLLTREAEKIILTRPIVEAGESLGFLPGDFDEKVDPYMRPMWDAVDKLAGYGDSSPLKDKIMQRTEVAPIAYMRGRSQPLTSPVLTPTGYVSMGELKEGDNVVGSNGLPTQVIGVYPQGELDVYQITFTDGVTVECSADHLWETSTLYERRHKKGSSAKTTAKIMQSIKHGHAYNHQIPICKPVHFENAPKLPVDPYVLGVLLGDGSLHEHASITFTSVDQEIVQEVEKRTGLSVKLCENRAETVPSYRLSCISNKNVLRQSIRNLELLGSQSSNKFIPMIYQQSTVPNRLELLRGLMDSDGCCFEQKGKRNPRVQYYSTSESLARDVAALVYSLGGTASIRKRKFTEKDSHKIGKKIVEYNQDLWVVGIRMYENPFKLKRKASKFVPLQPLRAIKSVKKIGRKECQCIQVNAKDSLYLTNCCVVTHNTFDNSVCVFDEAQNATKSQLKLFLSRLGENSKMIITGDPRQSDIGSASALMDVTNRLKGIPGVGVVEFQNNSIVRHSLVGDMLDQLEDIANI